jgi:hypothetical protein
LKTGASSSHCGSICSRTPRLKQQKSQSVDVSRRNRLLELSLQTKELIGAQNGLPAQSISSIFRDFGETSTQFFVANAVGEKTVAGHDLHFFQGLWSNFLQK